MYHKGTEYLHNLHQMLADGKTPSPYGLIAGSLTAGLVTGEDGMFSTSAVEEFTCVATRDSMLLKVSHEHLRELFSLEARLSLQHSIWVKQYNSIRSDKEVLDEIYETTDGDHWHNHTGWLSDTDPDEVR